MATPIILLSLPIIVLCFAIDRTIDQQSSILAENFLRGHLGFTTDQAASIHDRVPFEGNYFWALGPFPSILLIPLMPLHWLTSANLQVVTSIILTSAITLMIFRLARTFKYDKRDSLIWALTFVLGSAFIGLLATPNSWYYSQIVAVALMFLAIYEFFRRRRWWLIGLSCAGLLATRLSAGLIIIFFITEIIIEHRATALKIKNLAKLLSPYLATGILLAIYNYLRFKNIFETGYNYQELYPTLAKARSYGLFSLKHIPGNLYFMLLSTPQPVSLDNISYVLKSPYIYPDNWGMSIFLTSPYLLWFFTAKWKMFSHQLRRLLLYLIPIFLAVVMYYGIGVDQFGYRYAMDFFPVLFIILMQVYRRRHRSITLGMQILFVAGCLFNFFTLTLSLTGRP
jgi:hypothetical protein